MASGGCIGKHVVYRMSGFFFFFTACCFMQGLFCCEGGMKGGVGGAKRGVGLR